MEMWFIHFGNDCRVCKAISSLPISVEWYFIMPFVVGPFLMKSRKNPATCLSLSHHPLSLLPCQCRTLFLLNFKSIQSCLLLLSVLTLFISVYILLLSSHSFYSYYLSSATFYFMLCLKCVCPDWVYYFQCCRIYLSQTSCTQEVYSSPV